MTNASCPGCGEHAVLGFDITMAFQPIINLREKKVFAYEALVRGTENQSAGWVLSQVNDDNRYVFDQKCRTTAITLAAKLGVGESEAMLSINFLPNAVYNPAACIKATLAASRRTNFPENKLIFEITEGEKVRDPGHLTGIVADYRRRGFRTAIDDFGAGYSGMNLLTEFQPDIIKIDMELIRNIDTHPVRQAIVESVVSLAAKLDILLIAEGIETTGEMNTLRQMGIDYFQGYLFAKPAFEALPEINWQH